MNKFFKVVLPLAAWLLVSFSIKATEKNEVINIIHKVNRYWQKQNPVHGRAFWDNAVYHTGNMEAYFLTGDATYKEYSEAWAQQNEWKGAKSDNKSAWKLNYGESDEYVLFGDYQACFQTYCDLYTVDPDPEKIARARQVMEYEMSTNRKDYWWWADGLYMAMPVMTKLYKITNDKLYLNKLYEYTLYCDSLMYDKQEGLYYRDARYVYPNHKSGNGKKDFWARGDGWAMAALAKVLKDLPKDYANHDFFVKKFQKMATALAASQQPEGYWTRSIYDPSFAPGPETSGTALMTYGLLWGINNGYLNKETYAPVCEKAWNYLSKVALQPNGKVGYVQPIGDRAIPGQVVDKNSTSNFGVGAFLLASCEMARYLGVNNDRAYWANTLYKIASPVLKCMSNGKLSEEMQVEVSPTWDGRDKHVTYMECFGRLMAGVAPWLSLPDDNSAEGKQRKQLREWALASYKQAVDPQSPDYLLWRKEGQPLVDAAYVAQSFLRAYDQLWMPLDETTKQRYIAEFQQLRRIDPPYTNWLLFSSTIECFLAKAGAQADMYRIHSALRKVEEWYVGDSWYSDGTSFAFDYYNSYVIQPMYVECLKVMIGLKQNNIATVQQYEVALKRMQKYSQILERFISPEGTYPVFGRSIPYRMGVFQPLAQLAWNEQLPAELPNGQVRSALTAVMHRMFDSGKNFNEKGFLRIGFTQSQPNIADWYTNNGSMYITSLVFLPLGLPASHPFWTNAPIDWTSKRAWNGDNFSKDHAIHY